MSEELREKAKAATPGPWRPYHAGLVLRADGAQVGHAEFAHDAAFIAAANPSAILSLLDERDRLLAANEGMRKALERIDDFWTEAHPEGPDGDRTCLGGLASLADDTIEVWRVIRAALSPSLINSKPAPAGEGEVSNG